jgi:hypothetical protein
MTIKKNLVLCLSICVGTSYSQSLSNFYPNSFSSYTNSLNLISSSYIPDNEKLEVSGNFKSLFGELKKVATYSFTAARIFERRKTQRHAFRINFLNEKEGSFITSPRFNFNYAIEQAIKNKISLMAGINIGMAGVYYTAPTVDDVSGMLPDGAIGVGTKIKGFSLYLNSNQIFNASKNYQSTKLKRYYQLFASQKITMGQFWVSKTHGLIKILPNSINEYFLGTGLCYNNKFEFGSVYKINSGISFYSIFDIPYNSDLIKMYFYYNSSAFKINPKWQNSIELGFSYRINK